MIVEVIRSAGGSARWGTFKTAIVTKDNEYAGLTFDASNPDHEDEFGGDLEQVLSIFVQLGFLDLQYKRTGSGKLDLPLAIWTLNPKGVKWYERGSTAQRHLFLRLAIWQRVKAIYEPIKVPVGMAGTVFTVAKLFARLPDMPAVIAASVAAAMAIVWGIFKAHRA
jgi:hypothetical protein